MAQIITNSGKLILLDRGLNASPTRTAPTLFTVGTGTTAPAITDTDLVTPVDIDGDNFKAFVTGYPTLDTTAIKSTIRCFLTSLEANGNTLTEFGIVNSDATKLLFSRATHTGIAKTTSVEVTYVEKDGII
jgi:hypothetical protein